MPLNAPSCPTTPTSCAQSHSHTSDRQTFLLYLPTRNDCQRLPPFFLISLNALVNRDESPESFGTGEAGVARQWKGVPAPFPSASTTSLTPAPTPKHFLLFPTVSPSLLLLFPLPSSLPLPLPFPLHTKEGQTRHQSASCFNAGVRRRQSGTSSPRQPGHPFAPSPERSQPTSNHQTKFKVRRDSPLILREGERHSEEGGGSRRRHVEGENIKRKEN